MPDIRRWVTRIQELRRELDRSDQAVAPLVQEGHDVGGSRVNNLVKGLAEMQSVLGEFRRREILIKDLERGLIDFPALIGGREVFLCWEVGEDDIEHWHDLDTGFSGRERL